mmetsp:Transcript_23121/g.52372  ORF Transcript_23121/g.52372 Transcript_23121/m.52372 type:complete len:89 (-) Transcript_23121:540-806(-)
MAFGVDADLLSPTLSGGSAVDAGLHSPGASGEPSEGRPRVDAYPPSEEETARPVISPPSRPATRPGQDTGVVLPEAPSRPRCRVCVTL